MKIFILTFLILFCFASNAHCPKHDHKFKLCMMYEDGLIYVYPDHLEHNGPYIDFPSESKIQFSQKGKLINSKKVARGIYKPELESMKSSFEISINDKKYFFNH